MMLRPQDWRRRVLLIAFTGALPRPSGGEPVIWSEAEGGNGHRYEAVVVSGGVSWSTARDQAEAMGGYLATLTSESENLWVFENLVDDPALWEVDSFGFLAGPHIGLEQDRGAPDYAEPAGGWKWITGEAGAYVAWGTNQPNNVNGIQDVAHYWAHVSPVPLPTWQDVRDTVLAPSFIVEFEECRGDIDGDGDTDVFDFGTLAGNFGNTVMPGEFGDLNGDGTVDVFDFAILAPDFGCTP